MKIFFALFFSVAGFYGIFSEHEYISSSDAVVSAYVLDVRTPIEGQATGVPLAAGGMVVKGQVLARVVNPLNDQRGFDELKAEQVRAESSAEALKRERSELYAEKKQLESRTGKFLGAVNQRMGEQTVASERSLGALMQSLNQATADLRRGEKLHQAGIMADADYEKLISNQAVLSEEVAEARAALATARTEAAAANRGILSEPGTNNDVAYSQQRTDEIAIRLAENARQLSTAEADAQQASDAIAREWARAQGMSATLITSPIAGQIWRLNTINDEHAGAGTSVMSLIDCSREFVIVDIPQERIADIQVGHTAYLHLTGESEERQSQVLSVESDPQTDFDHKLAALPYREPNSKLATVILSLGQGGNDPATATCAIGRNVRVRIPTKPSNYVSRWQRHIF
jgi:multidrug resistance efflux pump